ncbi:MAG: M48 family metalloprotease [Oscillospiraceae bacterium]|nr:M48 family metalloprotease [Oscillospiraceae bacterium]
MKYQKALFSYQEIRKNKIKTSLLVFLYVIIILVLSIAIGNYIGSIEQGLFIGLSVVVIVLPINILTSKFFIVSSTKGKPIDINNLEHLRVKNLVEGLAISAGLERTPDIYIMPTKIPNAFAGGFSPKTAYIGVTQGLLDIMSDSELEGVIAHEMSHIAQYDVLISTVSVSLFSVAIILGDFLYRISWYGSGSRRSSRKSDSDSDKSLGVIILAISILAIILSWFIRLVGNLVNLSISRKREYAADASAVRLCGYPGGLASALSKLASLSNQNKYSKKDIDQLGGENLIGLYIFNPMKSLNNLFSTHPPIEDRINKLNNMY